jgi:hypothetical protein
MGYLTSQNIWRAIVARIRQNAPLKAAIVGGIHEGLAPENVPMPYLVYTAVVPGVNEDLWGSRTIVALADLVIVSRSSAEASNLDQSVTDWLDKKPLPVIGQSTLICHRVGDIRDHDQDDEGRLVHRIGGSFEIMTDQIEGVRVNSFVLDAILV